MSIANTITTVSAMVVLLTYGFGIHRRDAISLQFFLFDLYVHLNKLCSLLEYLSEFSIVNGMT